ncbi:MAG TPA: protein kinase [Gemmatimonadaceae bacterium]|jgi:serine/threonine-protein kinase
MPSPQLIGPQPDTTPVTVAKGRGRKREIPKDLLQEASHRLGVISLVAGVLWIVATVLWHLTYPAFHPGRSIPGLSAPDWIAIVSGLASLGLCFFIRHSRREPQFFLQLGLANLVWTCFALGLVMHWGRPMSDPLNPEVSWIAVVLLMSAAILPVGPRNMTIAALVGASMGPLTMALTHVHGLSTLAALRVGLLMHYSDFLVAGVAIVIARVVTRLGRQVSKARELGSYQLGELIKKGGMGEIYKATHRMLARPAAIKLIRAEVLASEAGQSAELAVKRFHREAEAAANLRCPHTVELFDFGITEDETLYFVMELLEGMDLETLVRKHGPMPARRAIHIMRQVCESLEEAHTKGLVHRDIKPANIHIGTVGVRHDFVKVLDFGLVKSVKKQEMSDTLATAVGWTPGTPAYMAPEMALAETVDARADIYALGCVTYFLLTGRLVFEADGPLQMVAKHFSAQPVPPSRNGGIDVPPALDEMILKCLAKKPDDRPQSAAIVSQLLAEVRTEVWSEKDAAEWWAARAAQEFTSRSPRPDSPAVQPAPAVPSPA